jgi:hypothetical protein
MLTPLSGELIGLPSSNHRILTPMNAPTETKSPCEKFSVFVVVKVMLKPRAINA